MIEDANLSQPQQSEQRISSSRQKRSPPFHLPHRIKCLFFDKSYYEKYLQPGNSAFSLTSKHLQLVHENPNIYLINNFLLDSEIQSLDNFISENAKDFQQSFTEDNAQDKIYSTERTSKFFFLTKSKDRVVRNIETRAADLVGLPVTHVEPLQVIHYTAGQQFTTHHDAGTLLEEVQTVDCILPRRLITLVVYLNSLPFGNGFTEFPLLKLSVLPRRGQALLFCNILPSGDADFRVIHKANPVHSPLQKYGLNIWISEKPMPMETYEMHQKPKKKSKRNINEVVKEDGKKTRMRLQSAESVAREFCTQHIPVENEELYFVSEPIDGFDERHSINGKLEESIPTGKNFFFDLNSFADYDLHDQELVQKILQSNKISLPLAAIASSHAESKTDTGGTNGLYFTEESSTVTSENAR
jgi:prolyl 4-hydroxylase